VKRALSIGCVLLALVLAAHSAAPQSARARPGAEPPFRSLFNGTDLTGWEGNSKFWSVKDGAITGQTTADNPTQGNTFLIWRQGTVEDFELQLSYRMVGGNSGIQYRSKDLGNWVVGGYQADIEAGKTYTGILYEEKGRGILAKRGEKTVIDAANKVQVVGSVGESDALQAAVRNEDWNDYRITARGGHMVHAINGRVMVDVTDELSEKRAASGILALQLHAGPPMTVQFKDIRLKRLPAAGKKRIVLVAGTPSHGPGDHEFNAGTTILKGCLDKVAGVDAALYRNGWPADPSAFDAADAVLLYMDGGANHPVIKGERLAQMAELMKAGVGVACVHYAVEVPKDNGGPQLLDWIGGYYETGYSINPHWVADFKGLPSHPIARGVRPFNLKDEWYFNIRFRTGKPAIVPILRATPPDEVRGTPAAKAAPGREEVVAWALQRPDGGRGFGFTGGHTHRNWGNDDFRKLVLNALVWTARMEVPAGGISSTVSEEELGRNLDPKPTRRSN
jgi:type 1 glutamine amidotransferase